MTGGARRAVLFEAYPHVYGGAQQVVHVLAQGLPEQGWTPSVLAAGPGRFVDRLRDDGIHVRVVDVPPGLDRYGRSWRGTRLVGAATELPRYWARLRPELSDASVVYTATQRGAVLAGPAARLARVPLVWNVLGFEPSTAVNFVSGALARRVLVISAAVETALRGLPPWTHAKVVPAPWRLPVESGPSAAPVVVSMGRVHPDKGTDVLVRATALLRPRAPGVRVLVIGQPQQGHERYWEEVQALRASLGLEDAVELCGFVPEPLGVMRGACIYVQPSRQEAFGIAAMEAMALGLPVVVSDVGGLAELVEHERTGLVVPPDDSARLADAIARLLDDRRLAVALGHAGAEHVRRRHDADAALARIGSVFDEVAHR